jgi:hypothetical protein
MVDLAVAGSPSTTVSLPAGILPGHTHRIVSRGIIDAGRTDHNPRLSPGSVTTCSDTSSNSLLIAWTPWNPLVAAGGFLLFRSEVLVAPLQLSGCLTWRWRSGTA